jgi:hypothetical protein
MSSENTKTNTALGEAIPAYQKEVIYGHKETMPVDLEKLIRVSQIRKGTNQELVNLKESIQKNGLLNQIDVARMREQDLREYLEFVGQLWGNGYDINNYSPDVDGNYYLVIAGHSRVEAIEMIAWENPENRNILECKIYDSPSPQEIISIQLAENIHQQPSKERQAIAIVETYHYGLNHGEWDNKADFIRKNEGKFSKYSLDQAMHFASLPQDIRGFVSTGAFSYVASVELGRVLPIAESYFENQFCKDDAFSDSEEIFAELDKLTTTWLAYTVAHIQNNQLNGPAAKKYIQGLENNFKAQLSVMKCGGVLELEMCSPTEQMKSYRKDLERRYGQLLRELSEQSLTASASALSIHLELFEDDGQLREELSTRLKNSFNRIGFAALKSR